MKVLVFSAHPDDAEYAMGGTLVQLHALGHEITLIVLTDGSSGSYGSSEERAAEQKAAAELIGAKLLWGGVPDCRLEYTREQAFTIAGYIREAKPDIIFCPHWDQQGGVHDGLAHPDHRALGLLVRDAARFARFRIAGLKGERHNTKQVMYYMVPRHRVAKIIVPVTERSAFLKLARAHKSQLQLRGGELEEILLSVRRSAAHSHPGVELAETFDSDEPILVGIDALLKGGSA
jgi:N-acetylglucosamine malate deacetylase 1